MLSVAAFREISMSKFACWMEFASLETRLELVPFSLYHSSFIDMT